MEICYLVNMNENHKTGLFNATHSRIKKMQEKRMKINIYCLSYYDNIFLSILKKFLKKDIQRKGKSSFYYDGICYKNIWIKKEVKNLIFEKVRFFTCFYLKQTKIIEEAIGNPDLISSHWGVSCGIEAYKIFKRKNIPYTITHHGSDIHTIPHKNKVLKKLLVKAMENASSNIFVSQKLKEQAKELGYEGKNSCVIYNGIDIEKFKVSEERKNALKIKLGIEKKLIGYFGNLYWIKNADSLPEIFKNINDKDPNIEFIIVGDGEYRREIEEKVKNYKLKVHFIGKIEPNKIPEYMSILDLLILPSRNEGMPLVTLEAKALGIPVIGSDVGGISEVISKNNVIKLDENFIENFAQLAIKKINEDKKIEKIESRFLWSEISKQEKILYKKIFIEGKK